MSLDTELRQVLAELELCSHVAAVSLNRSSRDACEDVGGKRPPGGLDGREDRYWDPHRGREPERVLRSAQHFRRQLERGRSRTAVLEDAQAALVAWRRQPDPKDPEYGSPQWKRWIAESAASDKELARQFSVSRQYIHRVRVQYAG